MSALPFPFLHTDFLAALADSGAVCPETGWRACDRQWPQGRLPLYLKGHSWGEFVFDHAWAQAYDRHGLNWYPKLVSASPFSPVEGPRWFGSDPDPEVLVADIGALAQEHGASSWHLLFCDEHAREVLAGLPLVERHACHFRWFNRDYADWDAFLAALTSRKRKSLRKERSAVTGQGLQVQRAVGSSIPAAWWQSFYPCYADTYYRRGQAPYLPEAFFALLRKSVLAEQVMLAMAFEGDRPVAAAFYLFDDRALYGRYWGAMGDYPGLHFELCYYQGIEFAIERGLGMFDPGVQGEHKLLRGFEPVITRSLHWIREPAFRDAIARFCTQEQQAVAHYQQQAREVLPFRRD